MLCAFHYLLLVVTFILFRKNKTKLKLLKTKLQNLLIHFNSSLNEIISLPQEKEMTTPFTAFFHSFFVSAKDQRLSKTIMQVSTDTDTNTRQNTITKTSASIID
jgi:TctA family transporter